MKALRHLPALLASCVWLGVAVSGLQAHDIPSWRGDHNTPDVTIGDNWDTSINPGTSAIFGDIEIGSYTPYIPRSGVLLMDIYFTGDARNTYTFSGDPELHSQLFLGGNVNLQSRGDVVFNPTVEIVLTPDEHDISVFDDTTLTVAGKVSGVASVVKSGNGTLVLSGHNDFIGLFTLAQGKLVLSSSTMLDDSTLLSGPLGLSLLRIDDGATLSASGAGVRLANPIELSTAGSVNFAGEASGSSLWLDGMLVGSHDITKTGPGTVVINHDNSATFTGGTHVQSGILVANVSGALGSGGAIDLRGGTLVANANDSLGGGPITFNGGALKIGPGVTLTNPLNLSAGGTLAGNYTFTTPQTLGANVTLSPGNSPGLITFTAGLALTSTGTELGGTPGATNIEINAITDNPGVSSDLIDVRKPLTFDSTLNLSGLSGVGAANKYTLNIISLDLLGGNVPGAVNGLTGPASWTIFKADVLTGFLADGSQFKLDSSQFFGGGIFSLTQSGSNLVLNFTPVPEPSTYALLGLGLGLSGLAAWRQRRRTAATAARSLRAG